LAGVFCGPRRWLAGRLDFRGVADAAKISVTRRPCKNFNAALQKEILFCTAAPLI
jgi:hypothetical protein